MSVARREPAGVSANSAPVCAHETGHPTKPRPAPGTAAAARQGEPTAAAGNSRSSDTSAARNVNLFAQFHPSPSLRALTPAVSFLQQISQHQERFIQMLNEPVGEGGDAPEVGDMGAAGEEGAPVNYIQVTPQEKEAIERVSEPMTPVL